MAKVKLKNIIRCDSDRLLQLQFIESNKILQSIPNIHHLKEYYSRMNKNLLEYLNPDNAYEYKIEDYGKHGVLFTITQQEPDPRMAVTLKQFGKYYILDFYFAEKNAFDKRTGLIGKYYLDTVCKIVRDEILPYIIKNNIIVYFTAHVDDGAGGIRKQIFTAIIDKFVDKNKFDIVISNDEFVIKLKHN